MPALNRIFPYENTIVDPVLIRKSMGQRKTVFLQLYSNSIQIDIMLCYFNFR